MSQNWLRKMKAGVLAAGAVLSGTVFDGCTATVNVPGTFVDVSEDGVFVDVPGGQVSVDNGGVLVDFPGIHVEVTD